jgi:hypothetical protein
MLSYKGAELNSFVEGIRFTNIAPSDTGLELATPSLNDLQVTRLPVHDQVLKQRLKALCEIPRMSTFAIGAIINYIVSEMPGDKMYLNVGVWNGYSLFAGMIGNPQKICLGIDNFSEFGGPRSDFLKRFNRYKSNKHFFFEGDYEDYFLSPFKEKIGFYFYDGYHSRQHQCKGLQIAEPLMEKGSFILVDDANAPEVRNGTTDFLDQSPHAYEIVVQKSTAGNYHPTFWNGILLMRRID